MSGRRIDDFGGEPRNSDQMMDSRNKLKKYSSAEGSGDIGSKYPDTTEDVKRDQNEGNAKIRSKPMKPGYRY